MDEFAALDLPAGVALVPASQPGDHPAAIEDDRGTAAVAVPALIHPEVRDLAGRLGALAAVGSEAADLDRAATVDLIYARSRGNALYATYLCRQVIGPDLGLADPPRVALVNPLERLRAVPASAQELDDYYAYLLLGAPTEDTADAVVSGPGDSVRPLAA